MGTLLHSCVEVHEPIELSFGMVSGVGLGIDVLHGAPCGSRRRGDRVFLGFFASIGPVVKMA